MMHDIGIRHPKKAIVLFFFFAFAAMAVFAAQGQAYQRYNDGCQNCHGSFTGNTSPQGTVFPSGNKHEMHRASTAMGTACNLCHTSSDGRDPFLGSSDGLTGITGRGCAGCHNGNGLRVHHAANGVTVCTGCHSAGTAPAENTPPPYYGTTGTKANNACNPVAQANINENWSVGDFRGLDNDGDDLYDTNDPNCASVPAGPLSVTPAGGLTSSGTFGGPFTPSSLSYTLSNTGSASINWTAAKGQSWVTLSSSGGTLAAGGTATVTVSINSGANSLAASSTSYADTVTFTNTTNGTGNTTRPVSLRVNAAAVTGEITVMPAAGAMDVPVNSVVSGTLTGAGNITSIFNEQTFRLKVKGPATAATSSASPEDDCVEDGVVQGAISYNESRTAGTFTPTCSLTNATVYEATIAPSAGGLSAAKTWGFTTIADSPDTDDDGVPDNEDDHPGDKGKGTPPSSRGNGKFLIDVTATAGASLANTRGIAETDASLIEAGKPSMYEFKDGLLNYRVVGVTPGSTIPVRITFPSGIPAGSKVYKVGPAGFQEFGGATIQGNTVALTITDGGAGDSDGQVNGVIVDPIGVATPATSGSGSLDLSTGSSGGGCAVAPGRTSGGAGTMAPLLLLLIGVALRRLRKPGRRK